MRILIAGLLLSLSAIVPAETRRDAPALIAGEDAGAYPWMAALLRARYEDPYVGQFCGATLIAPGWALTAAHCVADPQLGEIDLFVGSSALRTSMGSRHRVAEIIVHPGFVPPQSDQGVGFDGDIALLRLAEPVSGITPVDLPGPEFDAMNLKAGTEATLLGWGALDYDNMARRATNFPIELKRVEVPVVAGGDCMRVMGEGEVSARMFCAGGLEAGADSCVGDSGGPLAVPADRPSGWLQAGIISWGLGCSLPGFYGVYTRLGKYADWISAQVCEAAEIPPRPQITELRKGIGSVSLEWPDAGGGVRYRVYYRPALTKSPVRYVDVGEAGRFTSPVPWGVGFDVAVQSYKGPCNGRFSIIRSFILE